MTLEEVTDTANADAVADVLEGELDEKKLVGLVIPTRFKMMLRRVVWHLHPVQDNGHVHT